MSYGVKVGQLYKAADGVSGTYLVVDTDTYADVDDVVVFSVERETHRRIDAFKLARVRYYLVENAYKWKGKI